MESVGEPTDFGSSCEKAGLCTMHKHKPAQLADQATSKKMLCARQGEGIERTLHSRSFHSHAMHQHPCIAAQMAWAWYAHGPALILDPAHLTLSIIIGGICMAGCSSAASMDRLA